MIKKIFILWSIPLLLHLLFYSCNRKRQYCSANLNTARMLLYKSNKDYSSDTNSFRTVQFDSSYISSSISGEAYDCYMAKTNAIFIQQANAFKPAPPTLTIPERIDSIHYYTLRNYNNNYGTGDIIDNLFIYKTSNTMNWSTDLQSKLEIIHAINNSLNNKYLSDSHFNQYCKLNELPQNNLDTVSISVAYFLNNNTIVRDTLNPFILEF